MSFSAENNNNMNTTMGKSRGPLRELSPNKKLRLSTSPVKTAESKVTKVTARLPTGTSSGIGSATNALFASYKPKNWNKVALLPSSTTANEPRLSSPVPLLPRPSSAPPLEPRDSDTCRKHADRLKTRLRLAFYKVVMNQEELSIGQLPVPDGDKIKSYREKRNSITVHQEQQALGGSSASEDTDDDSKSETKKFITPPRASAIGRARSTDGATFGGSSPFKGHNVKGTPSSMGAARSLLSLGAF